MLSGYPFIREYLFDYTWLSKVYVAYYKRFRKMYVDELKIEELSRKTVSLIQKTMDVKKIEEVCPTVTIDEKYIEALRKTPLKTIGAAIAEDAGVNVKDLDGKTKRLHEKYYELVRAILRRPLGLKAIVPDYFIDRGNLAFIEKLSPSLARLLDKVVSLLEELGKGDEDLVKATLHAVHLVPSDVPELWKIEPEVCSSDDEFMLRRYMECSVRLDFRTISTSETARHIPIWQEKCLNAYIKFFQIFLVQPIVFFR